MLPSFFAAFFFAFNGTCARHNLLANGPIKANLGRLTIATLVLGAFAHTLGHGFASASVRWFFLSGVIGMGLGDLGVYAALPRLGSRITVLMTQCLAAPLAAIGERLWLGTQLSLVQVLWGTLILAGVVVAITPSRSSPPRVSIRPIGFLFGFVAACGQGFGALVSRKGVNVAEAAGEAAHNATFGLTSAYQRILAGLVFTSAWFLVLHLIGRFRARKVEIAYAHEANAAKGTGKFSWLLANGLSGPVFGVGCYQWALATTPGGVVLPIVATAPLLAIPVAFWLEGDRPSRRAIAGGIVAVAGCIALTAAG